MEAGAIFSYKKKRKYEDDTSHLGQILSTPCWGATLEIEFNTRNGLDSTSAIAAHAYRVSINCACLAVK